MNRMKRSWQAAGFATALGLLAACGGTPQATPATAPTATGATSAPRATTPAGGVAATRTAAPATAATRTTAPAAATRTATAPGAAATRTASPATGAVGTAARTTTPGTPAGRATASPATPSVAAATPAQAYRNLQTRDNYRGSWAFTGFEISELAGDLQPVYDYSGGNARVVVNVGGAAATEAYRIGQRYYAQLPVVGGYTELDATNPLAAPVQGLFETPNEILTNLIPDGAQWTPAGSATVGGRQATRYTGNVTLADLGFVDPSLAGQRGTAATTVFVDSAQGFLVGLESDIRGEAGGANTTAKVRFEVTNVGQVGPIVVPR
jgi:hypothetical protein